MAGLDRLLGAQRIAEPAAQEAAAHGGPKPREDRDQRAGHLAVAQRALDLQVPKARGVDDHGVVAAFATRRGEVPEAVAAAGVLGLLEVAQHRPGGADEGLAVIEPEAGQGGHAEMLAETAQRLVETERPGRPGGDGAAGGLAHGVDERGRGGVVALGVEQLRGPRPHHLVDEPPRGHVADGERSGRDLDQGQGSVAVGAERQGRDVIGPALLEQRLVDERAGGQHPGHGAIDDAGGLAWILDLVTDRHAMARLDHPAQVGLDGVVGDPRHGDALGALGERDPQDAVGEHRVVVEHLVEVAHPEKKHAIRVAGLEPGVLPHGGRGPRAARRFWAGFG